MVQGMKYYLTLCYSFLKISLLILELLGEGHEFISTEWCSPIVVFKINRYNSLLAHVFRRSQDFFL